MLPLRFTIAVSLCALALWGLFSLLENLGEPELLRSPKAVVIKGCDPMESNQAQQLCPQLICQKALLDARAVAFSSRFEVLVDRQTSAQHLIAGVARHGEASGERFACVLERGKVSTARVIDDALFEDLSNAGEEWSADWIAEDAYEDAADDPPSETTSTPEAV